MHARNDATVPGPDLVAALRRILPRGKVPPALRLTISPGPPGTVRLAALAAREDVLASGQWSDTAEAPAAHLRRLVAAAPRASVRFVFYDGTLAVNGTMFRLPPAPAEPPESGAEVAGSQAAADLPLFTYRPPVAAGDARMRAAVERALEIADRLDSVENPTPEMKAQADKLRLMAKGGLAIMQAQQKKAREAGRGGKPGGAW